MRRESDLLERIAAFIKKNSLVEEGESVLISLSGGPDSTFLLHVLFKLQERLGISKLGVLHINHGIRGDEAKRDEDFSKRFAESLKLPFYSESVDAPEFSRKNKLSLEEGARVLRESIYKKYLESWSKIALGHTMDDQIETIIMRLFKGSGIRGLSGIPPKREGIIRPILHVKRKEILEYLKEEKLSYVVDSSNLSRRFLRNRIRLDLIPVAEKVFGSIRPINLVAEDARLIWNYLEEELEKYLQKGLIALGENLLAITQDTARTLPNALKLALFYRLFGDRMRRDAFRNFLELLEGKRKGMTVDDLRVEPSRGFIFIHGKAPETPRIPLPSGKVKIGYIEYGIEVSTPLAKSENPWELRVARSDLENLTIRGWNHGDRIEIEGLGKKKVKKLFQEKGIPNPIKISLPVVERCGEIIWIPPIYKKEKGGEMVIRILPPDGLLYVLNRTT